MSDYDSSYPQQRVDVNAYNTKQEKQQQQIAMYGSDATDYGTDYNYTSAGMYSVHVVHYDVHSCFTLHSVDGCVVTGKR